MKSFHNIFLRGLTLFSDARANFFHALDEAHYRLFEGDEFPWRR